MQKDQTRIAQLLENIVYHDDQNAFEQIFQIFYARLLNFCIIYIKDKERAEEIVSNVFLKIWMKRKELGGIQNLETYLFVAVKNQSLNHIKQFSNLRVVYLKDAGINQLINTDDPGKELERKELIFRMNRAIDTLPQQCKIIFKLVKEEGLKYKEVAHILDISPRTVETQLVRAMKKLDTILLPYVDSQKGSQKITNKSFKAIKTFLSLLLF